MGYSILIRKIPLNPPLLKGDQGGLPLYNDFKERCQIEMVFNSPSAISCKVVLIKWNRSPSRSFEEWIGKKSSLAAVPAKSRLSPPTASGVGSYSYHPINPTSSIMSTICSSEFKH